MNTAKFSTPLLGLLALGMGIVPLQAKTLDVVASFTVLADVVQNIGGTHVHAVSLVPPNGDPHEFEPSPADARKLQAADLTFVSGEGLETWFEKLATAAGYKGKPIVASDGVKTHEMVDDGKTVTDPHVWNSLPNVMIWVGNIQKALAKADPEDAADFAANARAYLSELQKLNAWTQSAIATVPNDRRKVLTSHDAFGYFGREYGVKFMSPLGISTDSEASAEGVAKLIDQIKAEGVKVYFLENSNDPRLVEQIASATGAKEGGVLYVEALSKADGPAPTFLKMFRYNVDALVSAMKK